MKTIQIFNDFTCWLVWNERMLAHWTQVSDRCPLGYLSFVPVVLFDTPGIFRCRSQHDSVESSSLLHHSINLRFICFPWWSIDELENLNADRITVCFEPWEKLRARLGTLKTGLSPPVFLYWLFQGGTSVAVPYCYLFLLSVFILWFSYCVTDIFCKF